MSTSQPSREIGFSFDKIKQAKFHEYAIRFGFGGLITVITGILAKAYGPAIAGLFLAFPAILPASLTLVEKHQGDDAAGSDAGGAVLGSGGLMAFGVVVWGLASHAPAWLVLLLATLVWFLVSAGCWYFMERTRPIEAA